MRVLKSTWARGVLAGLSWCGSFGGKAVNSVVDHLESCNLKTVLLLLPGNYPSISQSTGALWGSNKIEQMRGTAWCNYQFWQVWIRDFFPSALHWGCSKRQSSDRCSYPCSLSNLPKANLILLSAWQVPCRPLQNKTDFHIPAGAWFVHVPFFCAPRW